MLPFSTEQFLQVFATFNVAIWPAQIVAYGVGLLAAAGVARSSPTSDRVASTSLAAMWLFTGISYHWLSFARVNSADNLFGAAFVLQAGLLCYAGFIGRLRFGFTPSLRATAGLVLTIYAAAIYPIIGLLQHGYPAVPLFGVTPCPVTIFTLGCFLMTRSPVPWWVLAIPLLWSVIGGSAAILLGVVQDWVLLASGILVVTLELHRVSRKLSDAQSSA